MMAAKPKVWVVRYQRPDGHFREINVAAATAKEARELADRRLDEQYGWRVSREEIPVTDASGGLLHDKDGNPLMEEKLTKTPPVHAGVERPDLLQEHYEHVSTNSRDGD